MTTAIYSCFVSLSLEEALRRLALDIEINYTDEAKAYMSSLEFENMIYVLYFKITDGTCVSIMPRVIEKKINSINELKIHVDRILSSENLPSTLRAMNKEELFKVLQHVLSIEKLDSYKSIEAFLLDNIIVIAIIILFFENIMFPEYLTEDKQG